MNRKNTALSTRTTTAIVHRTVETVTFHGDDLYVLREGKTVWVNVRQVCANLGIDYSTQVARLKGQPWATVGRRPMVATDGKARQIVCISHRCLPMWLATIDAWRVKKDIQEKLVLYQVECADALATHFFGEEKPGVSPEQFALVIGEIRAMRAEGQELRAANDALTIQVRELGTKLLQAGTISGFQVDWIRLQVVELAHMRCALAKNPHLKSARMSVDNRVKAAAQWGGCGQKRRDMPADRMPLVKACLAGHRADLEAELKQRKQARKTIATVVRDEQQHLFAKKDGVN